MQLSYRDNDAQGTYAGALVDMACASRTISRKLGGAVAQRTTVTVDTANAGTDTLTFTIDNTAYEVSWTGVNADKPGTVAAAIAAIKASSDVYGRINASLDPGNTDKFFLDSRLAGDGFTVSESADLSLASTTASVDTSTLGFGLLAVATGGRCKPVAAADFTSKVMTYTPTAEDSETYYLKIALLESGRVTSEHTYQTTSDSDATVAEIVTALVGATPDKALPSNTVTLTDSTTHVTISGALPGIDFEVTAWTVGAAGAAATATVAIATTTARVVPHILGISRHRHVEATDAGLAYYQAPMTPGILETGEIWVEVDASESPVEGDPVYCRITAGASEQAGAFRTSKDGTDCFNLAAVAPGRFQWGSAGVKTGLDGKLIAPLRLI